MFKKLILSILFTAEEVFLTRIFANLRHKDWRIRQVFWWKTLMVANKIRVNLRWIRVNWRFPNEVTLRSNTSGSRIDTKAVVIFGTKWGFSVLTILIIFLPLSIFAQEINENDGFLVAKEAYEEGNYSVAVDLFNKFIKNFPQSRLITEAQLYIAQSLFKIDKFIEARDILIKLEKSYVPHEIEDRLLFWLGQIYLKVKDFQRATEYFKKMIEMYPNSSLLNSAKMQVGWIFFQDKKYEEAKSIFSSLSTSENLSIRQEALFKKGETLFNMKDYVGVLDTYSIFSEVFFDSDRLAKVYFYMGEANFYLDNFTKAIEYYSNALEKSDDDLIKIASLQGIGWSYLKEDKLKEAEDTYLKIDEFKNKSFNKENLFLGKATLYYKLDKLKEALINYDNLIRLYPQSDMIIQALFGKAECLSGLLRFKEAIEIYKKVIEESAKGDGKEIRDLVDNAYHNLGWAYFNLEDYNSAIPEFKKASSSENDRVKLSALYHLADIYQNTQEFKKAIETYSTILKDYPDNSYNDFIQYEIGIIELKFGSIDSSILSFRDFNKSFNHSELLDDVNYYLGYAYFKNKKFNDTCEQLQKFLEAFPQSVYKDKAIYLLAVSFYNRGMFKEAIENFERITKEFRQNNDLVEKAKYEIANALYKMGEEKLAVERFRGFIENYPKSDIAPDIIFWLGQYCYENSQFELARSYFEKVIRMYPKYNLSQEAKYELGLTFLAEGDLEKAMESLKRLLKECSLKQIRLKTMLAIGDLLLEQNKQDEAMQMYESLIQLASSYIDSSNLEEVTEGENAKLESNNFLDYTEDGVETKKSISVIQEPQDEEADNLFLKKLIKITYIKIGDLFKENNNFSSAITIYRQAMKYFFEESTASVQFKIAECLEEKQDLDAAVNEYLKIPYLNEQDKVLVVKGLLRSARIYEDKEDWQRAMEIYEEILNYDVPETKFAKEKIEDIEKQIRYN